MFDGYRGTVVAGPIAYGVDSRELSAAIQRTPVAASAAGIAALCRPECSPVTSSAGSIGSCALRPHCWLSAISPVSVPTCVGSPSPRGSSCGCVNVWLIHQNCDLLARNASVSGSELVGLSCLTSSLPPPL